MKKKKEDRETTTTTKGKKKTASFLSAIVFDKLQTLSRIPLDIHLQT